MQRIGFSAHKTVQAYITKRHRKSFYDTLCATISSHLAEKFLVRCTIWGLRYENGKLTADDVLVPGAPRRTIPSFGEDSDGELYVLSFDGTIYEFTEAEK
jgi:hypothetical protein